jgi:hypothetical protein
MTNRRESVVPTGVIDGASYRGRMHPGNQTPATPNQEGDPRVPAPPATEVSSEDKRLARDVLATEYNILMSALTTAWSASLTRTSLFLGVLSAAGVAFGFASQGGVDQPTFLRLALLVLLLVLFLGIATFGRLVQFQRESMVYITGMNRIRHFFQEVAPVSRPYLVLPIYDDEPALYRSIGTGMSGKRPRFELLHLTVQTQGIVGIVTAVVAAGCGALAASPARSVIATWLLATLAFLVTLIALFVYWHRALSGMRTAIRPMHPTPRDRLNAPI